MKKRYAIIGTGSRSNMFSTALLNGDFFDSSELAAICDINKKRMEYANKRFKEEFGAGPFPMYGVDKFEEMIKKEKVDTMIVTTVDRTHHRYIIRAMEAGCDVVSEKPMTVDADKANAIYDAIERTGKNLRITFNYRYAPRNSKVKELLMENVIGDVISVHFEWLLDTKHGADYFRRWHRDKRNSGGLMVHKATHHFDLMNWWLETKPEMVYGLGRLAFYGRENAEERGVTRFYNRGTNSTVSDPFALDLSKDDGLREMYLEAEAEDGYMRDQSVFGDCISIEDDMSVMVKYRNKAVMTYHLTAYSPWEGYRIAFNGTKGRLEFEVEENSYISGDEKDANRPDIVGAKEADIHEPVRILVRPHWSKPYEVEIPNTGESGHGGGDKRLLQDVFVGDQEAPLRRAANHISGANSILVGIAANTSFNTGQPVFIDDLFQRER